jgi:hypothetical protein
MYREIGHQPGQPPADHHRQQVDGIAVTLAQSDAMAGGVQEGVAAALGDYRPLLLERA